MFSTSKTFLLTVSAVECIQIAVKSDIENVRLLSAYKSDQFVGDLAAKPHKREQSDVVHPFDEGEVELPLEMATDSVSANPDLSLPEEFDAHLDGIPDDMDELNKRVDARHENNPHNFSTVTVLPSDSDDDNSSEDEDQNDGHETKKAARARFVQSIAGAVTEVGQRTKQAAKQGFQECETKAKSMWKYEQDVADRGEVKDVLDRHFPLENRQFGTIGTAAKFLFYLTLPEKFSNILDIDVDSASLAVTSAARMAYWCSLLNARLVGEDDEIAHQNGEKVAMKLFQKITDPEEQKRLKEMFANAVDTLTRFEKSAQSDEYASTEQGRLILRCLAMARGAQAQSKKKQSPKQPKKKVVECKPYQRRAPSYLAQSLERGDFLTARRGYQAGYQGQQSIPDDYI